MDNKDITPQWLAGFFDGEGCISSSIAIRKGGRSYINFYVCITQKNTEILYAIASIYPDAQTKINAKTPSLVFNGTKSKQFLLSIYPYSIIKKEQIKLAIEFIDLITQNNSNINFFKRIEIHNKLRTLK